MRPGPGLGALPCGRREPEALTGARARLSEDVAFWQGVQYLFFRQWEALRSSTPTARGVRIIGDLPIYVAMDSVDVWAASGRCSSWTETVRPIEVAGCPPDGFSADRAAVGQSPV